MSQSVIVENYEVVTKMEKRALFHSLTDTLGDLDLETDLQKVVRKKNPI